MKRKLPEVAISIIILAVGIAISVAQTPWKETEISRFVPLPQTEKIHIIPPEGVPPEIAAFSGRWEGVWSGEGSVKSVLIVERIDTKWAEVIYATSSVGTGRGAWTRYKAKVSGPQIKFSNPNADFTFELKGNVIEGILQYTSSRYTPWPFTIKMLKIE